MGHRTLTSGNGGSSALEGRTRRTIIRGVATNVFILGLVSLLTDMSSEMIYPILPLFLTLIGATGLIIGLVEGAAETTASLLKVVSGWHSDRTGRRKPYVTAGYTLSMIAKPVLAAASTPFQVLWIRVTERVGKGIRSAPRDALIADYTQLEYRGRAFGLHKAFDSSGSVIGPLLAIPILLAASTVTVGTYRLVFLLATIPALVAVVVTLLFVRETPLPPKRLHEGTVRHFREDIHQLGRPFYLVILVVAVFYIGEISYAFFILRAYEEGVDTITTLLLYVLYNAVFVAVAFPAGTISDRTGRRPVIFTSFALFSVAAAIMAAADSLWTLAIGFGLFGVYKGTSEGVFKAFVTDLAPGHLSGTALGVFHTAVGLVALPGGIVAGLLWDNVGHWATFVYGMVTAATAASALALISAGKGRRTTAAPRPSRV